MRANILLQQPCPPTLVAPVCPVGSFPGSAILGGSPRVSFHTSSSHPGLHYSAPPPPVATHLSSPIDIWSLSALGIHLTDAICKACSGPGCLRGLGSHCHSQFLVHLNTEYPECSPPEVLPASDRTHNSVVMLNS